MTTQREAGYTMVEVAITSVMLMLLMAAFYKASQSFTSSIRVNERTAAVCDRLDIAMHTVERVIRAADAKSLRSKATPDDVSRATVQNKLIPMVGEWAKDVLDVPRTTLQFLILKDAGSTSSVQTTSRCGLRFVLDPAEQQNGKDDNGNGLVDEGRLVYENGSEVVTILPGVESFSLTVDGRVVRITVRLAQKEAGGRIHRAALSRSIYVRNSSG